MTTVTAAHAAIRFGLGASPGQIDSIAGDPRGWLLSQLNRNTPTPPELLGMTAGAERTRQYLQIKDKSAAAVKRLIREDYRKAYLGETGARTSVHLSAGAPFRERLVAFWSNHFTVSVQRPVILGLVGPFEREAIRPHVVGRFRDMLGAVVHHPAMLLYLDNAESIGPNSRLGQRRNRGLNENLAREILELHTLGVDGGYTQTDVREFARILTGWSIARLKDTNPGGFMFHATVHEPGSKTLLGRKYSEAGVSEGEAALDALSRHPSTARYIATKFARHFIADAPPASAIDRLARIFQETDGDLGVLARAIVDEPEAWKTPLAKVKSSYEFVLSALRAIGFSGETGPVLASLREFGQVPFSAPSPAGWPDTAADWVGPESTLQRVGWSVALADRIGERVRPLTMLDSTLGPLAGADTRAAIDTAPSVTDAVAMLFASPEFQRR
ncbi:MAG: DUF1800 domain-containing protein [Rhodospirillaceae bacterium]|nr:DUF1800 domain-containing protein [Rhodospirillaceae bacterium]